MTLMTANRLFISIPHLGGIISKLISGSVAFDKCSVTFIQLSARNGTFASAPNHTSRNRGKVNRVNFSMLF